jgi:MFS family permease
LGTAGADCDDAGVVAFAGGFRAPFARYWLSEFLADFGDGVRLAAFPLLAAQVTRSPTAVAAVTAVRGLPWLLGGAGLGVIVDRTDRRRLMLAVDITRAAVIAALAGAILARSAGLVLIYLTAFTTGAGAALRDTAAVARGAEALGAVAGGALAAAAGIRAPMLAGAVPIAAVTILMVWRHRRG